MLTSRNLGVRDVISPGQQGIAEAPIGVPEIGASSAQGCVVLILADIDKEGDVHLGIARDLAGQPFIRRPIGGFSPAPEGATLRQDISKEIRPPKRHERGG